MRQTIYSLVGVGLVSTLLSTILLMRSAIPVQQSNEQMLRELLTAERRVTELEQQIKKYQEREDRSDCDNVEPPSIKAVADERRKARIEAQETPAAEQKLPGSSKAVTTNFGSSLKLQKPTHETCLVWGQEGGCRYHHPTTARMCSFQNYTMSIDTRRIKVSKGGEPIDEVLHREESDEFLTANMEAVYMKPIPRISSSKWYHSKLVNAATPYEKPCDVELRGTTLLLERNEYANLWHTLCDWFNTFWTLETIGHNFATDPLNIIFLDGHSIGHLDEPWSVVFSANVSHIAWYEGTVCFENVHWIPKKSPLDHDLHNQRHCSVMDRFVARFLDAYGIDRPTKSSDDLSHVVIDRQPYLAHPRMKLMHQNNDRVIPNLQAKFPDAKVVQLESISFREQVELIANAKRLSGVHGAGLTHLIWLPEGAEAEEWFASSRRNVHFFRDLAKNWRPNIKFTLSDRPK